MRKIIRTVVKFHDYESIEDAKAYAEIIMNTEQGWCSIKSTRPVSVSSLLLILMGNKQIRKLHTLNRQMIVINSKEGWDVYSKEKWGFYYENPIMTIDTDFNTVCIDVVSYEEIVRLCNYFDAPDLPELSYKEIRYESKKLMDLEYCKTEEI